MYKFYSVFSFDIGLLSLIIPFVISFTICDFILNKFKFSNKFYIRFPQKFIIYSLIFIFVVILYFSVLDLFNLLPTIYCSSGEEDNIIKDVIKVTSETHDTNKEYYTFKFSKKVVDNSVNTVVEASSMITEKIVPNIGVSAAAGAATAAIIKNTVGMPLAQRLIVIGSTAAVTAAGTRIGLGLGSVISKNININNAIKNTKHADPQPDRVPSPDPDMILSPLENDMTSPLQDLMIYSLALDIFILILFIVILIIIFNRYILNFNLNFINSVLNKYMSIKIRNWFNKNINTGIDYHSKFVLFIFIINSIFIFLFVLLKIFIISELLVNIDSYIDVHNYIHCK
jgi:uncharacterized membrane protein